MSLLTDWLWVEARASSGDSLLSFIPMATPTFQRLPHLKPVADLLVRAQFEPVRACISIPPRHGKTEILLHALVWWLLNDPTVTCGYISHTASFAEGKSLRARSLAQYCGLIRDLTWRQDEWRVQNHSNMPPGGVIAMGAGGALLGHGLNRVIIDDPFSNRQEAESPLIRERLWEWLQGVVMTRLQEHKGVEPSLIVVHTRFHDDDLIGRLSKTGGWQVINLPAIGPAGESLWPEKWPAEIIQARRKEVGEYEFASQYLGSPRPKGAQVFHELTRYEHPNFDGARIILACDPAASQKTTADYSAIVCLAVRGYGVKTEADVLEVWRGQVSVPQLVRELVRLQKRWHAPIAVEAVGGFKAIPDMLQEIDSSLRILPITPVGDKFSRAQPVAALSWDGRLRVPVEAAWLDDFLRELYSFTGIGDKHDDQIDALSHAYNTAMVLAEPTQRGAIGVKWI